MSDRRETKRQLIDEISRLRQRIAELEATGSTHQSVPTDSQADEQTAAEPGLERDLLNSLLDAIPTAIYFKDREGRHLRVSKYLKEDYKNGYCKKFNIQPPKQIVGKTDFDLYLEEHARQAVEDDKHIMETRKPIVNRIEHIADQHGVDRYSSTTKAPLLDRNGNVIGIVGITHDVTERIQAEKVLRNSEEKYRAIVETVNDAMVLSQASEFLFFNQAFERLTGYTRDELLEIDINSLFLGSHAEFNHDSSTEDTYQRELQLQQKSGKIIDVEMTSTPIDLQGRYSQLSVLRDITEHKMLLKKLLESKDQMEKLGNLIPICSSCKKIRDDTKEPRTWVDPAQYINDRLPDVQFTHSVCPDCMRELYPDYYDKLYGSQARHK